MTLDRSFYRRDHAGLTNVKFDDGIREWNWIIRSLDVRLVFVD
jgi:hypothetical protein